MAYARRATKRNGARPPPRSPLPAPPPLHRSRCYREELTPRRACELTAVLLARGCDPWLADARGRTAVELDADRLLPILRPEEQALVLPLCATGVGR